MSNLLSFNGILKYLLTNKVPVYIFMSFFICVFLVLCGCLIFLILLQKDNNSVGPVIRSVQIQTSPTSLIIMTAKCIIYLILILLIIHILTHFI